MSDENHVKLLGNANLPKRARDLTSSLAEVRIDRLKSPSQCSGTNDSRKLFEQNRTSRESPPTRFFLVTAMPSKTKSSGSFPYANYAITMPKVNRRYAIIRLR